MERFLPIGSVVEADNMKLCLLGARMIEKAGKMELAYYAVKYPRGYAGKDSLGIVFDNDIQKVFFQGNEGKLGKKHNVVLKELCSVIEGKTPEEAAQLFLMEES